MPSLNRCEFMGNLGADPELRHTAAGEPVANLRLAVNEKWKDQKTGVKSERTEWVTVVAWGKAAEVLKQYASKGDPLWVSGRLATRKWQDKDGADRYSAEIVLREFQFIGGGRRDRAADGPNGTPVSANGEPPPHSDADAPSDVPF